MENTEVNAIATLSKPLENLKRGDLIALNKDYAVQDLEKFLNGRLRPRGKFITTSFSDFKNFVEQNESSDETPVFVDHQNATATAVLNYANEHAQGHCDHLASLQLEQTVVWAKLKELKGEKLDQRSFAIFLEDWASVLEATSADGATFIDMKVAINAIRNMTIDASSSKDSSVESLSESSSSLDRIEAKAKIGAIPAFFTINDQVYLGLENRDIKLRLVIHTTDGKPYFSVQIVKEELLLDEVTKEFKQKVIDLLPDLQVYIGTFTA